MSDSLPLSYSRITLQFHDPTIEKLYRDSVIEQTMTYCRIAWIVLSVFNTVFGFLDRVLFWDNAWIATTARIILSSISLMMFVSTFIKKLKPLMVFNSPIFIMLLGIFSSVLIALDADSNFSPFFLGFFFGAAGIFSTAGMSFKYSILSFAVLLVGFEIFCIMLVAVPFRAMLIYNFFLPAILLVFGYAGYLIEQVSRKNFLINYELKHTIEEFETLSGLVPICSSCKSIRDDQGYWKKIETYIANHSKINFSHSICPDCARKLYPEIASVINDIENE
jgi:hypothetical protein